MWQQLFGWLSQLTSKLFSRSNSGDTLGTPSLPAGSSPGSLSKPVLPGSSKLPSDPLQPSVPPAKPWSLAWFDLPTFQQATGLSQARALEWFPHIEAACAEFDINTPVRMSAFLAQVGHESGGFVYTRELWGPTAAQVRYEGRADLGNVFPGDGFRFRGRGLLQVTGRYNYETVRDALGVDVILYPERLEGKPLAARASAWWWQANGCNELADAGDFRALTRRINGGTNGLADRESRYARARLALDA